MFTMAAAADGRIGGGGGGDAGCEMRGLSEGESKDWREFRQSRSPA